MKRLIFALAGAAVVGAALAMPVLATPPGASGGGGRPTPAAVAATAPVVLGSAVQVVRGRVISAAGGLAQIELSPGHVLPVRLPGGAALPLGHEVIVAGTPQQNGPLQLDRVISIK